MEPFGIAINYQTKAVAWNGGTTTQVFEEFSLPSVLSDFAYSYVMEEFHKVF